MTILMMLFLPIQEHGICFHLFVSSLILSSVLCSFLSTDLLSPWLGLFPGTLFFLLLYRMGFFSWFLFLQFRCWCTKMPLISEYWLCILMFCKIHLIGRVGFLVESIGFSIYTIISSANNDSFVSSFPIWMPFISFTGLIAVARNSNTMLNRSEEVEILLLFLILVESF